MLSNMNIEELNLPIERIKIDGPIVKALASRKEDNDNPQASVAEFEQTYDSVKGGLIAGFKEFCSFPIRG